MSQKKKSGSAASGKTGKTTSAQPAPVANGEAELQAQIKQLHEELKKEQDGKSFHQIENDKLHEYWNITKKQLEDNRLLLEIKDQENEKQEARHQEEIKSYKQKIKHLLFEYQTNLTRIEADANKQVDLAKEDAQQDENQYRKQIRELKLELKELELSHQEVIKNLKSTHHEELLKQSLEFDQKCKELFQKYSNKVKNIRDEQEIAKKTEIHEIEERKNEQINLLIKSHEKSFAEMKNYYNDITLNNLALINSLKEQLEELKKTEERNEKMMSDISAENKKLKDPLEASIAEGDQLKRQLKNYEKDQTMLKHVKGRLKNLEEKNKEMEWEYDILMQRFDIVSRERNDFQEKLQGKCREMEQKVSLKDMIMDDKLQKMKNVSSNNLDNPRDGQLWNIAQDIATLTLAESKDEKLVHKLYQELLKAINAHNSTVRSVQDKLGKYQVPAQDLVLKPIALPKIFWRPPTGSKVETITNSTETSND